MQKTYKMDKIENRKNIGKKIAAIRNEKGWTQRQLADKCGLQQSHIARIEQGKYSVGIDILTTIVSALDKEIKFVDKMVEE